MDQMSAAELFELVILSEASIDNQFQFWLSITFATVVASFITEHRLTHSLRLALSCAYLLAAVVLMSRWYYDGVRLQGFGAELQNLGHTANPPWVTIIGRSVLMIAGSVATVWFVYFGFGRRRKSE